MRSRPTTRLLAILGAMAVALGVIGCALGPDDTYGTSHGDSLNGTSVLATMLKDGGHEVRAAIRLNEELADWAGGIIRFAPYPGPPADDEAAWFRAWLAAEEGRWLIYVVRDFDAAHEYWKSVAEGVGAGGDPLRKADAEESRDRAADWVYHLPKKAKTAAAPREWFEVGTPWIPPRACKKLDGPWANGIDATAAALTVHEPFKTGRGLVLLEGDGKPLVVEKTIGPGHVLLIANGSFLLNEAVVNPARRPLAELVVAWADRGQRQVAMVEGSFLLGEVEMPTLWDLLRRLTAVRWVAIQVSLAALMATLARAPRLGRARPAPPSGADRPAEHALALGALLARDGPAPLARDILARYRRWRHPRTSRPDAPPRLPPEAGIQSPGAAAASHPQT
jgi:hypothetical protein